MPSGTGPPSPLYERYYRPVFGYCHRRLAHGEAAADATSQTFARALAGIVGFRSVLEGEDGAAIVARWWQDAHPTPAPPSDQPVQTPYPEERLAADRIGQTTPYQLHGFREIDTAHVGASVELGSDIRLGFGQDAGNYDPTFQRAGYIVSAQQRDGRRLIDAFVSPLGSVLSELFPGGSATPAA